MWTHRPGVPIGSRSPRKRGPYCTPKHILKSRPAFRELYDKEQSFITALREKLKGIKQKLSSVIVIAPSAAVSGYDFLTPIVSGVDVSSIAAQVPSWAWPPHITALVQFLRNLADSRHKEELAAVTGSTREN